MGATKIFVSWAGDVSKEISGLTETFLSDIFGTHISTFHSENIQKGKMWLTDIMKKLSLADLDIICLTKENLNSPWITFEAGAVYSSSINKNIENPVIAILFGVDIKEIKAPVNYFQATFFTKESFAELVKSVSSRVTEWHDVNDFLKKFEEKWTGYEKAIKDILEKNKEALAANSIVHLNEIGGIKKYYNEKIASTGRIKELLLEATKDTFISGIALGSIEYIFEADMQFKNKFSEKLKHDLDFNLTIVVLAQKENENFVLRDWEIDRSPSSLQKKINETKDVLLGFRKFLIATGLNKEDVTKRVAYKYYTKKIMPRHFIIKSDNKLSVGAYFSHSQGSSTYLIDLENTGDESLYNKYIGEIENIKRNSEILDFDNNGEFIFTEK